MESMQGYKKKTLRTEGRVTCSHAFVAIDNSSGMVHAQSF